jgi:hypothetical protein
MNSHIHELDVPDLRSMENENVAEISVNKLTTQPLKTALDSFGFENKIHVMRAGLSGHIDV